MKTIKKISHLLIILCLVVFSTVPISVKSESVEPRANIAQVTIYSTTANHHSWLVVKNVSSSPITIGHYYLYPNTSVSIGTWGNISQHKGIWYNLESALGNSNFSTHVSISRYITSSSQLNSFNTAINSSDGWSLANTCSYFSGYVWCQTFSDKVNVGSSPSLLANSIKSLGGYTTNRSIPTTSYSNVYYHTSSGKVQCSNPIGGGSSSGSKATHGIQYVTSFTNDELEYINSLFNCEGGY